ncbi:MAG: 50S ribosomal protein L32 [Acidobacteria bacterium 37-65-4]|nr:MAG: 50S ribosomal protein L32 [Acidobacteria bacterium 37-65-4]
MPNPRRRHSKTRRNKRRTGDALSVPNPSPCPKCHEPKMPHQACMACGYYDGREVIKVEQA